MQLTEICLTHIFDYIDYVVQPQARKGGEYVHIECHSIGEDITPDVQG
jgi:hypothetical protein